MKISCVWSYTVFPILLFFRAGNVHGLQLQSRKFGRAPLLERFAWQRLDFSYPDERSRQLAIANGEFVPENALPVGIEIWRNKLFVTIPRWRDGEDIKNIKSLIKAFKISLSLSFFSINTYVTRRTNGLRGRENETRHFKVRNRKQTLA